MILMRMLLLLLTLSAMLLSPSLQDDDDAMFGDFIDGFLEKKGDALAVDHHLENKTESRKMKRSVLQEEEKKKGLHKYEERTSIEKPARFQKMVRKCGASKQMTAAINGAHTKSCFSWDREQDDDSGFTDFREADYNEPMHHPPSNN